MLTNLRSVLNVTRVTSGLVLIAAGCASTPTNPPPTTTASTMDVVHVAIARDGSTTVDGTRVDPNDLPVRAREIAAARPNAKIVIDAEREVSFQLVMSTIERLKQGGETQFTFGTIVAISAAPSPGMAPALPRPANAPTTEPHASVPDGTKWDCPFPMDGAAPKQANVLVRVQVETDGKPLSVDVLEDPSGGVFGTAAKKCALDKAYGAAHDLNGQPIRATTFPFYIKFVTK